MLALLSSALFLPAPVTAKVAEAPFVAGRQVTDLSTGWRFHFGGEGEAPAQPGFDDSGWETVSVPHA